MRAISPLRPGPPMGLPPPSSRPHASPFGGQLGRTTGRRLPCPPHSRASGEPRLRDSRHWGLAQVRLAPSPPSSHPWQGAHCPQHQAPRLLSGSQQHRPGCRVRGEGGERARVSSVGLDGQLLQLWGLSQRLLGPQSCSVRARGCLQSPPHSSQPQGCPRHRQENSSEVLDAEATQAEPASPPPGAALAHLFFSSELKSRTPASSLLSLWRRSR